MNKRLNYDILIIGCGISGLTAAITAAESGLNVAILSKENDIKKCNTFHAQGGIVYTGKKDSPGFLKKDIIVAGDNINYEDAVDLLCNFGPKVVKDILIDKVKVPFCLDNKGKLDRTKEAAHSTRRIIHVKDHTGKAIENSLITYADKLKKLTIFNSYLVIDLITNTHNSTDYQERYKKNRVIGAYVLD